MSKGMDNKTNICTSKIKKRSKNNVVYGAFRRNPYLDETLFLQHYNNTKLNYALVDLSLLKNTFTISIFPLGFVVYFYVVQSTLVSEFIGPNGFIVLAIGFAVGIFSGAGALSLAIYMLNKSKKNHR